MEVMRQSVSTPADVSDSTDIRRRFRHLFDVWKRETCFYSFPHQIHGHWAYEQILSLGEPAIPYLLGEIQRGRRGLGAALRAISGESPVRGSQPTTEELATAWMAWGEAKGHVPSIA